MTTRVEKCGIVEVGPVRVQLLAEGDAIVRMMRNGKVWEPQTRALWGALVRADEVVIDVGAYTGIYAIAAALLGARALAIEPHPANYRRIQANAAINSVKFDVLWMAAGETSEIRELAMDKPTTVINDRASFGDGEVKIPIVTKRIDDLEFKARVGLIKIDVEHFEMSVIAGALKTIWIHKPYLIVETLSEQEAIAIKGALSAIGYTEMQVLDVRNRVFASTRADHIARDGGHVL